MPKTSSTRFCDRHGQTERHRAVAYAYRASIASRCKNLGNTCKVELLRRLTVYRVGQKSELLILSEYVNKTEKIGGM